MGKEGNDYQKQLQEIIDKNRARGIKPSLLLHSCCAPCSTHVIEKLKDDFDITVYFFNPNIMPKAEYDHRLSEQLRLLEQMGIKYIDTIYANSDYLTAVQGLESEAEGGARCEVCFRLRLDKTAKMARAGEFNYFCTTLTVSPHKDADLINKIGSNVARKYNLLFLPSDFKKEEGYKKSIELSKKYNLYRQDYCGCGFSAKEQGGSQDKE